MPPEEKPVILIAEDDPDHVGLLRRALDHTGYGWPVYCVTDGEQAIAYLAGVGEFGNRKEFPVPTMLLLDLKMPRKSGFDVMEWLVMETRIRPTLRTIRVVVLTASDQIQDVNRAYQLGAASFLVKPVDFGEFSEMVRYALKYWTGMNTAGSRLPKAERST